MEYQLCNFNCKKQTERGWKFVHFVYTIIETNFTDKERFTVFSPADWEVKFYFQNLFRLYETLLRMYAFLHPTGYLIKFIGEHKNRKYTRSKISVSFFTIQ